MHETIVKGILSANHGMNLYRGCTHGCIYCDSRSKCYQMKHVFEDIEVKINAPKLLDETLSRKRNKCMIATGAMTDPYLQIEETLCHTRKCLEIILKHGFGVTIITKSDRILRDLDLLEQINNQTKCVVQMTLTTYDEELCKVVEPNVCTTKRRFEVLKILQQHNIPTVVWLTPILPFINDTRENIEGILNYCIDAKVYGIICFSMGLTLRDGNREYYYQKLDEKFPGLKEQYIKTYGNSYELNSPDNHKLMALFRRICSQNNIEHNVNHCFSYLKEFGQKDQFTQISLDFK